MEGIRVRVAVAGFRRSRYAVSIVMGGPRGLGMVSLILPSLRRRLLTESSMFKRYWIKDGTRYAPAPVQSSLHVMIISYIHPFIIRVLITIMKDPHSPDSTWQN